MARQPLTVGERTFSSKKEALDHYRGILSAYNEGSLLHEPDRSEVILLAYASIQKRGGQGGGGMDEQILDILVNNHPVFKSTKCFWLIWEDGERSIFSYTLAIYGERSDDLCFSVACRNAIRTEIREFKKKVFSKRPVSCGLTGRVVEWEECHVDHKAPLTFSVIVRSFVVANNIDIAKVAYDEESFLIEFADLSLRERFARFHREMAVLRIVSAEANAQRASAARVRPTRKDGRLM